MPSPLFAVSFRFQQAIDHLFVRIRRIVGEEFCDFCRGWRQAGQVVGDTTQQRGFADRCCRRQAARFELIQHEVINRVCAPFRVFDLWNLLHSGRCKGPVFLPFSPLLNPASQKLRLGFRQTRAVRRHLLGFVGRQDTTQQFAVFAVFGDDRSLA